MSDSLCCRARDIFLEIIDLPSEERSIEMERRCAGDVALRARVMDLVRADAANREGGSAFDQSFMEVDIARDPIPVRVGAYAISGFAGEGGMGQVFDAIHEPTRRRAAVKLLHVGVSSRRHHERLRVEAQSLARLSDPCIARVYDADTAEVLYSDGTRASRPFIAMEFVDGLPIVEYAGVHQLSIAARLLLIERVLRAVHHAHQRAVIHRDLKPSNILVTPQGPKIVDFGIARLLDSTQPGMTVAGQIVGTLRYMSPEQALGEPDQLDTRCDVYSIGAILYELLADQPLVPIDTGSSLGDAIQWLQRTPARLANLKPELAGDIDAIVHKAIEREPNDRYGSAQTFAEDLRAFLEGREVSARSPTTIEWLIRAAKRNKTKVAVAALIVVSLIAGIIGASWGMFRAQQARLDEVEHRRAAERSAEEARISAEHASSAEADAQAFSTFLVDRVLATARPKDMQGGLGLNVTVAEALTNAESNLENDFAGRPAAQAIARRAIGVTWRHRGEFDKAATHLRRAIELAIGSFGPNHEITLDIQNSLVVLLQMMGRNDEGVTVQERIVKGLEASAGLRALSTIAARYNLAIYKAKAGDNAAALKLLEQVHGDRAELLGPDHMSTLSMLADIAEIHQRLGDGERALTMLEELSARFTSLHGEDHPATISATNRLAFVHQQLGDRDQAMRLYEQVLPRERRAMGDQHPLTLHTLRNYAMLRLQTGDTATAVPLLQEYSISQGRLLGERSAAAANMLCDLAGTMLEHRQYPAAEDFARRCLSIREEIAPGSEGILEAQRQLEESLEAQGRNDGGDVDKG